MMRYSKKSVSSFALFVGFVAGLGLWSLSSNDASAETAVSDLCVGTGVRLPSGEGKGACVYTDASVPVLAADVCWDGSTARLRGANACPSRQLAYFAKYGEVVDPMTGEIAAYAPLPDACSLVPCAPAQDSPGPQDDSVACCDPETDECYPTDPNGNCPLGEITWCKDVEANGDGTVTCHE